MTFVCHVNLCFKTFFFMKWRGKNAPKWPHSCSVSHVKVSDKAVMSLPACLSVLDWKIISDACLISDKNLAEHRRCQRAHDIVFLGLFRFTATVLLASAIPSLTSHLPYVVPAPHRGLLLILMVTAAHVKPSDKEQRKDV